MNPLLKGLALAAPLLLVAAGSPQDPSRRAPAPKGLLGSWQGTRDPGLFVRFEERRAVTRDLFGGLVVLDARYEAGSRVRLRNVGMDYSLLAEAKGDVLTLRDARNPDDPETTLPFRRLKSPPKELELGPLPLGKPAALSAERTKGIREDLARRVARDQEVREDPEKAGDLEKVDEDNAAWLQKLATEIGWIDAKRFGREAATGAFLLVQHGGDLRFKLAALSRIEADVKAGLADPQDYALLHDRVHLMLGGKQRYGTQVTGPDGEGVCRVLPLEDRAKVEQVRKELGLFPLAEYLEIYKEKTGARTVRLLDDWE